MTKVKTKRKQKITGKLKIGDSWNAISIIALSQNNPLKAIAEFVENSIDARSKNITIIRGKEQGEYYLKVIDDGEGIPLTYEGIPDFKYVATHICDSIKCQLKREGISGIQGEFGIGMLSFWIVGDVLTLTSAGNDGKTYQMQMMKGNPDYSISQKRHLFPRQGTELIIRPILKGIKQINGEKIQRYLASEIRDRIKKSGVDITVIDRTSRTQYKVEPRQFDGRLLHNLPAVETEEGETYIELYLNEPDQKNTIGLYRSGTRVIASIDQLDFFQKDPWTSGYFTGIIDVPFLNLTPGTRDGIIHDSVFASFTEAIKPLEEKLLSITAEQKKAEEEKISRHTLKLVQNALKEALLTLPHEEYDWFDIYQNTLNREKIVKENAQNITKDVLIESGTEERETKIEIQKAFFEFPGPLYRVIISPASAVVSINGSKTLRAIAQDRSRKAIEENLKYSWQIIEGSGTLNNTENEIVIFNAKEQPGLVKIQLTATQNEIVKTAESIITVTEELFTKSDKTNAKKEKGLPAYTFHFAPGELWRSRYGKEKNIIIINNGHRDFVFASKNKSRKLRYICKLYAKELVVENFPGLLTEQLLERMIELSFYTEENLR